MRWKWYAASWHALIELHTSICLDRPQNTMKTVLGKPAPGWYSKCAEPLRPVEYRSFTTSANLHGTNCSITTACNDDGFLCVLMWDIQLCWICVIKRQLCLTALLCQCPAVCYICVKKIKSILRYTEISQWSIVHTTKKDIWQVIFTRTHSSYTAHHEYYIHFPTVYKYLEIFCITYIGTALKHFEFTTRVHRIHTRKYHYRD